MGGHVSCCVIPHPPNATAKVISLDGNLHQFLLPISVSRLLLLMTHSKGHSNFFLCNSDTLFYNEFIPPLALNDQLQPHHLYFLLPISSLDRRLCGSDMSALALRATLALQSLSSRNKNRRVSPVLFVDPDSEWDLNKNRSRNSVSIGKASSRKLQSLKSNSRAKMKDDRSFRLSLSTIHEGSVL